MAETAAISDALLPRSPETKVVTRLQSVLGPVAKLFDQPTPAVGACGAATGEVTLGPGCPVSANPYAGNVTTLAPASGGVVAWPTCGCPNELVATLSAVPARVGSAFSVLW
mmetsp:Transcript_53559/g.148936  ORF Transcript_53559/g.148936 Transcript_53559/m.148936 type:complete len:111 (-) Transcript_53559:405-737(-)